MRRIVKGRSSTETKDFTFTPTGTPTLSLVRVSDGTAVTTSAVSGSGEVWSYTIPASSNTLLDTYVETWTATTGSQPQTFTDYIEVAGGTLFDVADARALKPLDNTTTYPDAAITRARTYAETELENECGLAFVPRYRLETITGDGGSSLMLSMPRVRAIRSISVDGTALTVGELADLTVGPYVITGRTWSGHLVVGYEHGWDSPPPGATESALLLAKQFIVRGPVDDRATQRPTEFGPINLATAGMFGSRWGLPSVDAFVRANNMHVGVA